MNINHKLSLKTFAQIMRVTGTILILASCQNPFQPPKPAQTDSGIGYFAFTRSEENIKRTIKPDSINEDTFVYRLEFSPGSGNSHAAITIPESGAGTFAEVSLPIPLDAGLWNLVITAYSEYTNATDNKPAAQASVSNIDIQAGQTYNDPIELKTIPGGAGTFSWDITFEDSLIDDIVMAKMTVYDMDDEVVETVHFITASTLTDSEILNYSLSLEADSYRVKFELEDTSGRKVERRDILHVYTNLTSHFEFTFKADHFIKKMLDLTVTAQPIRTLIAFDSDDLLYGNDEPIGVSITGLDAGDTVTVSTKPNLYGLSLNNTADIGASGAITLRYDGTTAVTQITPVSVTLTVSGNEKYTLWDDKDVNVTIIDGQDEARAIPVTQANIEAFNTYANTIAGLTRHYELTENVTLTPPAAGQSNWTAIGENLPTNHQFTGSFNGQGNSISDLTIYAPSIINQGMFGYNTGTIKNLGLVNVNITGFMYVGGVAGTNMNGTVEKCYVTGIITGIDIENFSSLAGGIIGLNEGDVKNCYVKGTISNDYSIGGITGNNGSQGTIQNCYVIGSITALSTENGDGGGISYQNFGTIENCIVLAQSIKAGRDGYIYVGRIVSETIVPPFPALNGGTFINNYAWSGMEVFHNWDGSSGTPKTITTTAFRDNADGEDISAADVKIKTHTAWATYDFTSTWTWDGNGTYMPSLHGEQIPWPVYLIDQGDGTSVATAFKVYDVETLKRVGKGTGSWVGNWSLSAHYEQIADIDLSSVPLVSGSNWTPIGTDSTPFTGTYNGGDFSISNLTITSNVNYQGMFSAIGTLGKVTHITLIDCDISGGSYTGGIAGILYFAARVEYCRVMGDSKIEGSGTSISNIGGIAGQNWGAIQYCYSDAYIYTESTDAVSLGGVVGKNIGTVQDCYATGTVSGIDMIGGVVGENYNGTVQNCSATGNVFGLSNVGGIVGYIFLGNVQNCIALNQRIITSATSSSYIGRIIGYDSGTLNNNYAWNGMKVKYNVTINGDIPDPNTGTPISFIDDSDDVDGEGISAAQAKTQTTWQSGKLNFSFGSTDSAPWQWEDGKMPRLYFETEWKDWPAYLVDY